MAATAIKTTAALTFLAAASWYFLASTADDDDDEDFDEDELTVPREQVLEIFRDLKKQMPQKMQQVVQQLEAIRAQYPTIPQEQLSKLCTSLHAHRVSFVYGAFYCGYPDHFASTARPPACLPVCLPACLPVFALAIPSGFEFRQPADGYPRKDVQGLGR